MSVRARRRRRRHVGAAFAVALLPLSLNTSQAVSYSAAMTSADTPAAPAGAAPAVAGEPVTSSRSAERFALLEQGAASADARVADDRDDEVKVTGPKGTRVWTASAMSDHDIPAAAVRSYRNAARTMARVDPSCGLPWTLLAGIGRVESDHGRYGGAVLARDGVSHPRIIGIPLDGVGPVAAIRDTDNGRLDGDKVWDRAVGPMQFIPSTWAGAARDGDSDGTSTPNDLDDAALAAAAYLCSGSASVRGHAMAAAVYRYNQDDYYVALVLAFERGYRSGVFVMPSPPAPEDTRPAKKKHRAADKHRHHAGPDKGRPTRAGSGKAGTPTAHPSPKPAAGGHSAAAKPNAAPSPKPKPSTSPSPKPSTSPSTSPSPTTPQLIEVTGTFQQCGAASGWCLGSTPLDLGPADPADPAADDYDGDGETGTVGDELAGLAGQQASLLVEKTQSGVAVVYVVNGMDYRNADGSPAA